MNGRCLIRYSIYQRRYPISELHVLAAMPFPIHDRVIYPNRRPSLLLSSLKNTITVQAVKWEVLIRLYISVTPRTIVFKSHSSPLVLTPLDYRICQVRI